MPIRQIEFPFQLGEVVQFKAAQLETGITKIQITKDSVTTIQNFGQTKMIPPMKVVVEVILEDIKKVHLFDEQTGKPIKNKFKVKCIWFSQNTGKFEERWFNSNAIMSLEKIENSDFALNDTVVLKTQNSANKESQRKFEQAIAATDGSKSTKYKISRTFNNLTYLPPLMLVTGFGETKKENQLPIYDKSTGKQKRLASKDLVKCMWYDYKSGKYSEQFFIKETIMKAEKFDLAEEVSKYIN